MLLAAITVLAVALGLTVRSLRARGRSGVAPGARNDAQAVQQLALVTAVAAAIVAVVSFAWFLQHNQFMEIDRCLDAGGAWDYEQEACRTA